MNFVQPIRNLEQLAELENYLRYNNERNWLLLVTGINTGLRISDLLTLRVRDVQGEHIVIREQKTKKRKWIHINSKLRKEFKRYIKGKSGDEHLFMSRQGTNKPLGRSAAYKILRKAADAVGIRDIGTHTLRKTFGYHMYLRTKDVALLQELFNHSSPAVTLRYIGISQDTMDQAMSEFSL